MKAILWFDEIGLPDVALVGGKGANLGEMTRAKLPVPNGFVVTSDAFRATLEACGARDILWTLVSDVRADDPESLSRASETACATVRALTIPQEITEEVRQACRELGHDLPVAVRSSGTSEDLGDTSFAGMNASFTNVSGDGPVLQRVLDCWASLYAERAISYRATEHVDEEPAIAVIVQAMVPSECSGVIFTVDPSTDARDHLVIEAVLGQGEAIVSGMVEPDTYVVDKAGA